MRGFDELASGATHTRGDSDTGGWYVIYSNEDAVYSAKTVSGDDLSSGDWIQGTALYGDFYEITVTSGSVMAYRINNKQTTVSV